jgi:DNA polymerase-3 subunit epsilon
VVADTLGIEYNNHHNALSDARTCAEVFLKFLNGVDPDTLEYKEAKKRPRGAKDENRVLSSDAITQDLSSVERCDTIFYDKKVVITGVFENFPIREDLALLLKSLGAKVNMSLSKKTDIFVVGKDFGPAKMEKVYELAEQGHIVKMLEERHLMEELKKLEICTTPQK